MNRYSGSQCFHKPPWPGVAYQQRATFIPRSEKEGTKPPYVCPGSFVFRVVTPLYLAHLDYLTVSYSFCDVQDFNRSFAVG
jgi:hypothetical protein